MIKTTTFHLAQIFQLRVVATSLWLALVTVVPVLIYTYIVHRAIRAIEPCANSVGLRQIAVSILFFSPFEAGLILPAINLWISHRILRAWDISRLVFPRDKNDGVLIDTEQNSRGAPE